MNPADDGSLPPSYSEFVQQTGYVTKGSSSGMPSSSLGQIDPTFVVETPPDDDGNLPPMYGETTSSSEQHQNGIDIATVSYTTIPYLQLAIFGAARNYATLTQRQLVAGASPHQEITATTTHPFLQQQNRRRRVVLSCSLATLGAIIALVFFVVLFTMRTSDLDTANNLSRLAASGYFASRTSTKLPPLFTSSLDLLGLAITRNRPKEIRDLLKTGQFDVNAHYYSGLLCSENVENATALILATACRSSVGTLLILINEGGAELEDCDDAGWTALIWSAVLGETENVELLLNQGAVVDARTKTGKTALNLAAINGYTDIIEILLNHGASRDGCDSKLCEI